MGFEIFDTWIFWAYENLGVWAKPRVLRAGRTKYGIMHEKNKNSADKCFLSSIIPVNDEMQIGGA